MSECPAGLALCGTPCGCKGRNASHRPRCRAGCPTKDHATWGDCARAARIQIDRAALAAGRHDTKEGKA